MSALPSVSFQISGPVVSKWTSGFAGFLNCCGSQYFVGSEATICSAFAIAPPHALGPLGQDQLRAEGLQQAPPLE